jgi:D-glycero-D-manno-heptose 1,7-bisphosphate phosphatase
MAISREATLLLVKQIAHPRRALFLDRDGVINVEKNYVHQIEDFEFLDGIFELCRAAVNRAILIVVITNQAGIGRGLYTEMQFHKLTNWMKKRFQEENAPISGVYFCPYHPLHGVGSYRQDSIDRKPNPGMLLRAQDDLSIDLSASILIGDKETDIIAARAAGVGKAILLDHQAVHSEADKIVASLYEARKILFPEGV